MNPVISIANRLRPKSRLKVLTFITHEKADLYMARTNADFFALAGPGTRQDWNTWVSPIPTNYNIFKIDSWEKTLDYLPKHIEYDFILSQNKASHFPIAKELAKMYHLPILTLEHTDTMPQWPIDLIKQSTLDNRGQINCFISEYSKEKWYGDLVNGVVVDHGIDGDLFCPGSKERKNHILSVCNDWINRDLPCGFSVWKSVVGGLPVRVVGDTPGLSKPSKSLEDCINEFQTSRIFLNTSQFSPLPMSLMEAMACGCAVVSSATGMIPEIIENGVDGFITNDQGKMRKYLETLLGDPELCKHMGQNAREKILAQFPLDKFVNRYNEIFQQVRRMAFVY